MDPLNKSAAFCLAFSALLLLAPTSAGAESKGDTKQYSVNALISDGSSGRVWRQWKQNIDERAVREVSITLRKQSGGPDTFVNLRFGREGETFENGRRVYLPDNSPRTVTWQVGGAAPQGRELILNAYKGEVFVEQAKVRFVTLPKLPRPKPTSTSSKPSKPGYGDSDSERLCEAKRKLRPPRIEIDDVRSRGNMFSNKYRIEGSVVGACIEEAVYVEDGELKERIMTRLSPRAKRYPLKLNVRSGRRGVIRVLNSNGDEDRIKVDRLIESYGSRSPW